jgi:peroxiredoxin
MSHDPTRQPDNLPDDLPAPADDGAADHLLGSRVPSLGLPSTRGGQVRVDLVPEPFECLVVYAYPRTGRPGAASPSGWDEIPGARGCTPESCGFRDHAADLGDAGAAVVGLSTQSTAYQQEAAERLALPFPLLSDAELRLTRALNLPTFTAELEDGSRATLLKRLTLVIREGRIVHTFYPVFPPDSHAERVLEWLRRTGA